MCRVWREMHKRLTGQQASVCVGLFLPRLYVPAVGSGLCRNLWGCVCWSHLVCPVCLPKHEIWTFYAGESKTAQPATPWGSQLANLRASFKWPETPWRQADTWPLSCCYTHMPINPSFSMTITCFSLTLDHHTCRRARQQVTSQSGFISDWKTGSCSRCHNSLHTGPKASSSTIQCWTVHLPLSWLPQLTCHG